MGTNDRTSTNRLSGQPSSDTRREAQKDGVQDRDLNMISEGVQTALEDRDLSAARTLVADAEAILAAHSRSKEQEPAQIAQTKAVVAANKARIALTAGDSVAARAILVQAIERWPEVQHLRGLMAEVMMAAGRAKDVRTVIKHLSKAKRPDAPRVTTATDGPTNEVG